MNFIDKICFKLLCVLAFLRAVSVCGQELSVYQSYLVIPELHNPAYNGALPCTKLSIADKHQWLGIADAPSQQMLSANLRFERDRLRKHGVGVLLLNDRNGANKALGARFSYAYHIMVQKAKGHWLSLALSGSAFNKQVDASGFMANSLNDPLMQAGSRSATKFDLAFGLLYYTKKLTVGMAGFQLVPSTAIADQQYKTVPLWVAHADYSLQFYNFALVPGARLLLENKQHLSFDANIKYVYKEKYWCAFSARAFSGSYNNTINSMLIYLGFSYKRLSLSYAADFGLTALQRNNWASHELCVGFLFCKEKCSCTD